ncbi:hypothetical protein NDU88_005302 [Pleurodeles waltl]|uniref:L1 transposable element RRM domain-containing protein n=1 Tax=Pleurodeles waltl TaxID=8319 RepID=A0AAV7LKR2_PLEWA|nr:hypothetical protein NDU88_005302 [Pleurodeles waltl]
MVRPWNRLTSRGTVRSSLHEILRSPRRSAEASKTRILHDGPAEEPGGPKKCKPTETELKLQSRVTGLEQGMGLVEAQTTMSRDRDQDLLYLRSKLTDMEDRSRRDNIRLHGIPENEEGVDVHSFLRSLLPKLTSLDFDPPIEFQRAHRVGPKRTGNSSRPRPIIACLLRHNQTRQILQAARKHGPFQLDQYDIRITADYSKVTNYRRKAFLALRPRLGQLEIKYGLFDPARMWVTKNRVSKDFYNLEELQLFLDSFQPQSMDSTSTSGSHDNGGDNEGNLPPGQEKTDTAQCDTGVGQ